MLASIVMVVSRGINIRAMCVNHTALAMAGTIVRLKLRAQRDRSGPSGLATCRHRIGVRPMLDSANQAHEMPVAMQADLPIGAERRFRRVGTSMRRQSIGTFVRTAVHHGIGVLLTVPAGLTRDPAANPRLLPLRRRLLLKTPRKDLRSIRSVRGSLKPNNQGSSTQPELL
jgi:hypothetical protein